jgi:acyl carrier protein
MHSKEDIFNKVSEQLKLSANADTKITADTNIAEQFALDSVKVLDLLMEIEDDFDVSVPLNLMADVQTVNELVEVIYKLELEK